VSDLVTWVRAQWDRIVGTGLLALGAGLVLSGWIGVSGTSDGAEQLSYLVSGGVGGLFCLGAGATLIVSAHLEDEWRKLDDLTRAVRRHLSPEPADPAVRNGSAPGEPPATVGRTTPGGDRVRSSPGARSAP
jgi:hypothetical protein